MLYTFEKLLICTSQIWFLSQLKFYLSQIPTSQKNLKLIPHWFDKALNCYIYLRIRELSHLFPIIFLIKPTDASASLCHSKNLLPNAGLGSHPVKIFPHFLLHIRSSHRNGAIQHHHENYMFSTNRFMFDNIVY